MPDANDIALLCEYTERNSESAFAEIVRRHINLVYSVAFRFTGNDVDAQDVTQAVFIILAQKAARLSAKTILTGWLYETTRFTAMKFLRTKIRRELREQEAYMESTLNEGENIWRRLAPVLEEAMTRLNEKERTILALRFYENKSGEETAALLGIREWAVHKQSERAMKKLQKFFRKRGIDSTTAVITGAISSNAVQVAPVTLAKAVTAVAFAKGATASISTLTLIEGALKIMAWTKAKTAAVTVAAIIVATGTTTITVKEIQEHRTYPWQVHPGNISLDQVNQPPQVRILPSKFHISDWATLYGKMIGTGVRAQNVVASAYGFVTSARVVFTAELPTNRFDYIACLPGGEDVNATALQQEAKRKFRVVGRTETRAADVWLLKVKSPDLPGLKRNDKDTGNGCWTIPTGFHGWHESMFNLAVFLEDNSNFPVNDTTGLTAHFDFDLNCKQADLESRNLDAMNQALGKLGLELVPTNMPIKMLVVEKAK